MDRHLNYPLQPMQIKYLNAVARHRYVIIGARPGSGKSLLGIRMSIGRRAIIVCPASLSYTWYKEYKKFCKVMPKILRVTRETVHLIDKENWDVFIISSSFLLKIKSNFGKIDLIVVDEHHQILNPKAKRTKHAVKLVENYKPKYLMLMSGTPNKGKGKQWFVPMYLCSLEPTGSNGKHLSNELMDYWDFQHRFCVKQIMTVGGRQITQFEDIRNVEELKSYLQDKFFRYPAPKIDATLYFKDIYMEEDESFDTDAELLRAIEAGEGINEHIMSMKARSALHKTKFVVEYVKDLMEKVETPIIIFTDHRASQTKILEGLPSFAEINGETPMKKRNDIVDAFERGELPGLVATIKSANVGLTLTRSKDIVVCDRNWDYTENEQAYYRIFRIGQTEDCTVHQIWGSDMDEAIWKNIKRRKRVIDLVVEELDEF